MCVHTFSISLSVVIFEARIEYMCVIILSPSGTSFIVLFKLFDKNSYITSRPRDVFDTADIMAR